MRNCEDCTGSKQELCSAAFDSYKDEYINLLEVNTASIENSDPFEIVHSIGLLGKLMSGEIETIEELTEDSVMGNAVKGGLAAGKVLVTDLRSIGCNLEPKEIISKGNIEAMQEAVIREVAETADYNSLLPTTSPRRQLLEELEADETVSPEFLETARSIEDTLSVLEGLTGANKPRFETEEQTRVRLQSLIDNSDKLIRDGYRAIEITKRDIENDKKQARAEYIQEQGWDPYSLDFSQKLELKTHLKELGF